MAALIVANLALVGLMAFAVLIGVPGPSLVDPAEGAVRPSPRRELMVMGNAHIPTSNACVLCHGAGGEVKKTPAILHPIEGWRRCVTCHTDPGLGRTAPGHEGIAEEECLNCHTSGQAGPAITRPHSALRSQRCLDCHGDVAHLPESMASTKASSCVLCHKATELPPPSYPHAADARLSCAKCHRSAEAGGLPIDHALRKDDTCLLCHEIIVRDPEASLSALPDLGT